jgi:hypothetical protein
LRLLKIEPVITLGFVSKLNLALMAILLACIAAFGFFLLKVLPFAPAAPAQIINTSSVIKQVQTLSQLVTVKYVLEKVVVLEDEKWYGENRVMIIAHGIVKAGTDLQELRPNDLQIDNTNKRISIVVPRAGITDAYLEDKQTQVLERTTGLMRTFDKDLEQNARRQAVDEIKRAAFRGGIMEEANIRTQSQLTNLFKALGFEQVEVRLK